MANLSFTTSGATPYTSAGSKPFQFPQAFGNTPQAKALSGATQPNMSSPQGPQYAPPPSPSTPVKRTTVNNVDGSSHVTEYHPPVSGTSPSAPNASSQASGTSAGQTMTGLLQESPATGNVQTPSGATVNASSGGLIMPPPSQQAQAPTFSGLIGNLSSFSQPSDATKQALDTSKGAADTYNRLQQQLQESRTNEANAEAQNRLNPIPIGDQAGREAVIKNQYLAQQNALASQAQGATNLYGPSIGAAVTGQGQQIGAAGTAAGLGKPSVEGYGQTTFDPLTQKFGGSGGNLDPQTQATSLAQKVMSGQMTYDQALSSLGYAGSVGATFLNNAITGAGGNPLQLQASGSANQGVVGSQTEQVNQYKSALQQGKNLQAQLGDLITTFGLNPTDLNAVNLGLQKIASQKSDPHYKQLSNYVNDIANTYAQVLTPPGGSATDTSRGIAQSMLDATASGSSIMDTMRSLDNAAQAKIAGVPTIGGNKSSSGTGTNGSVSWDDII